MLQASLALVIGLLLAAKAASVCLSDPASSPVRVLTATWILTVATVIEAMIVGAND